MDRGRRHRNSRLGVQLRQRRGSPFWLGPLLALALFDQFGGNLSALYAQRLVQPFKLFHLLIGLLNLREVECTGRLKDAAHQSPIFCIDLGRFVSLQLEEVLC